MLSQYFWLVVFLSSFLDETKSSQKLNVPNISSRHEPEKRREEKKQQKQDNLPTGNLSNNSWRVRVGKLLYLFISIIPLGCSSGGEELRNLVFPFGCRSFIKEFHICRPFSAEHFAKGTDKDLSKRWTFSSHFPHNSANVVPRCRASRAKSLSR